METLALLGTQFDDALITTRNESALISGRGGYAPLQTTAMPFRISSRRVSLRLDPGAPLSLSRSALSSVARLPGSLVAAGVTGTIHHRVQFVKEYDERVALSLDPTSSCPPAGAEPEDTAANVIPLNAVRQARQHWDRNDAGMHLNEIMRMQGRVRRQNLPYLGANRAWRVLPAVLPSLLTYLKDRKRAFVRMVPSGGVLQAQTGSIETIATLGNFWIVGCGRSMFSMDFNAVKEVWVTASALHWQLELYDMDQKCFAAMAADPWSAPREWRELLTSLPRLN
ncbi:hypothetical protein [Shimia sp. MMG029]|uniref:hypothetical protein n=1 Tax=Shimia sp. MMG029 TaxID=3021978 RepID=UPI0022FE09D4|nr:hypothetical protein [Shimia sp. MMG029]